jgi:fatty-acyl-CoA synthase
VSGMMEYPLTPLHFIARAAEFFGGRHVVTAGAEEIHRHGWKEVATRARRASAALSALGVMPGDRIATLAWNTHRHLELYFAVPGMGCVLHTVNLRLAPVQIAEVVRHGGARILLADPEGAEGLDQEALRDAGVEHFVCLADEAGTPSGWLSYEALLRAAPEALWPDVDENTMAALCYTSGTTGEPKGVAYTHRAITLHTLAISLPDGFGISERDVVLPAVPMFHANAWGLPFAAAMTGASLVLPGVHPDPERFARLLSEEGVTFAAGVPTVWMEVLAELRRSPRTLHPRLRIHAGGAPTPPSLIEAYRSELGVEILTGWGMTELTPVGMVTHPRAEMEGWPDEELMSVRTSQGTPLPFVEARVVRDDGALAPPDGETPGELEVRGPWVTAGYYRRDSAEAFHDGWLRTGDVATRDPTDTSDWSTGRRTSSGAAANGSRAFGSNTRSWGGRAWPRRWSSRRPTRSGRSARGRSSSSRTERRRNPRRCSGRSRSRFRGGGFRTASCSSPRSPGPPPESSTRRPFASVSVTCWGMPARKPAARPSRRP